MMTILASAAFFLSLSGIVALFAVKWREERAGFVFAQTLKEAGDDRALSLKAFLARCRTRSSAWLPMALLIARYLVHRAALAFAAFAALLERRAHELADLVSHKHGFERRATRSDFLRQVSEYKNGQNDLAEIR